MNNPLDLGVVKNAMHVIGEGGASGAFDALGISQDDFDLVTGNFPWIGAHRPRVTAVIDSLTHGTLDVLGLPRIAVPGEYRAAMIAIFVAPCNHHVACRWLERGHSAVEMVTGTEDVPVSAQQLFSMVLSVHPNGAPILDRWRKVTGRALLDQMEGEASAKETLDV